MRSVLSFLITSLIGSFIYLGLGWLVFDMLLGNFSDEHTTQLPGFKKTTDFSFSFLYLSCLAYAVLITYLNSLTIHNQSAFQAFLQAACIGLLIACMTDFYWYASSNFYSDFSAVFVDLAGATITVGLLGLFNHLILKNLA
jgi:hypothetical protein